MEQKSVAMILQEQKAELEKSLGELRQLQEAYEARKAEVEALKQQVDVVSNANKLLSDEKQVLETKISELQALVTELKNQMALTPVEQITEGVPEGKILDGAMGEPVNHKKVLESLRGAERIKYYREHKDEIDRELK